MATMTTEQIEQKKQLLAEKVKQMKAIYDELVEAGVMELSEDELDGVAGGGAFADFCKDLGSAFKKWGEDVGKGLASVFTKEAWEHNIFTKEYWEG